MLVAQFELTVVRSMLVTGTAEAVSAWAASMSLNWGFANVGVEAGHSSLRCSSVAVVRKLSTGQFQP